MKIALGENLGTHQAIQIVKRKPITTSWITESLPYHFQQWNSRMQNVRTRSRSWSKSLRNTSARNRTSRIWARRRKSTSSARNRRNWLPTWTTPRDLRILLAKNLPNNNVLNAILYWDIGLLYWSCRAVQLFSSRTTTTSPQSLTTLLRRKTVAVPNTDFLKTHNELPFETNAEKRHVNKNTEATQRYLHDDMGKENTEIRWKPPGWQKKT